MVNSMNNQNISEGAKQILDIWNANKAAGKYNNFYPKSQSPEKDVLVKSDNKTTVNTKEGADDGVISFKEKALNLGKGIITPIKTIFNSPENVALTLGTIAAGAGLIAITGGAAAPVLVAAGLLGGGYEIAKGIYNQSGAKTDDEAKKAWQDIGTGIFTTGLAALGAKSAAKAAKIKDADTFNTAKASLKCLTNIGKSSKQSASSIKTKFSDTTKTASSEAGANAEPVNSIFEKIKGYWEKIKGTSEKQSESLNKNAKDNNIIKVDEKDIEIIPPTKSQNTPNKNISESDNIIDAEFKEIKNN